jgi:hypothetical protein
VNRSTRSKPNDTVCSKTKELGVRKRARQPSMLYLQRLTSALSEATTLAEIGNVVTTNLREIFAADVAALQVAEQLQPDLPCSILACR